MAPLCNAPYNLYDPVTPSDTVDLVDGITDALWVGGVGNVVLVREDDVAVTLTAVPAGTLLPMAVQRVNATNTTATLMVALYRK